MSQFDYLRRLADRLKEEERELRAHGEDGIRAIGVLGQPVIHAVSAPLASYGLTILPDLEFPSSF